MTMHTTGEPHGSYGDPPTMSLRQIPPQPGYAPTAAPGPVPGPRQSQQKPQAAPASAGRNGLIMAIGSLASRALGFVRSAMIVAALTTGPVGDAFNVGNSLPNIVYMMLIGGVLASVFVPELVHAAQTHKDGGVAYTDRLLTICGVILVILTLAAVFAAPAIVSFYAPDYTGAQRDLTIAFARYCLPQIFFYGVFTLLGQVLNSRDRFGAMMWTPVLNNVVAIGVFGLFMLISNEAPKAAEQITSGQTLLLGVGSTLGIVVQALALVPSLRSANFRWRPRFDWRGAGLTKPLRAAGWALALVAATQISFSVITRLATSAGAAGKNLHLPGVGISAYSNAYQLFVVPQGVITISLVTALLPQMSRSAAAGELQEIGATLAGTLRTSAAMIMPATVLFVAFAPQICAVAYGYGNSNSADTMVIAQALIAFAIGLPAFCAQYALARGFYAMGDARTPFWLTVVTTGTNAGLSYVASLVLSPRWIIIGMAGAQTVACLLSIVITGWALGRRLRQAPAAARPRRAAPEMTLELNTRDLGTRRARSRSGLDGGRVITLHLALALACLPGALAGHWIATNCGSALGGGPIGNLVGLMAGSLTVLVSLFVLARPLGAGAAVAPLARKLRIPYKAPAPAPVNGGKHRR
ncbi:murein biosynthesis integral membrane protein MurJ [Kitasatospora sp. MAP5-34]|uniref:murein biosynthesis integral membrane protein MurJ n=1 Tax=Kitasatospora sp. MAP5-34 TaxID=3035102 RepID=UPI0024753BA0|nr:murein biosynthesis integral membrane protein MurJ [Kitasatospora sp. MAP5-34]MDH6577054.1 putative peptidoglycan lipid II flippase [Kitasatospora sp. MAP5-34]